MPRINTTYDELLNKVHDSIMKRKANTTEFDDLCIELYKKPRRALDPLQCIQKYLTMVNEDDEKEEEVEEDEEEEDEEEEDEEEEDEAEEVNSEEEDSSSGEEDDDNDDEEEEGCTNVPLSPSPPEDTAVPLSLPLLLPEDAPSPPPEGDGGGTAHASASEVDHNDAS